MIKLLLVSVTVIAAILLIFVVVAKVIFSAEDHTQFDQPRPVSVLPPEAEISAAHAELVAQMREDMANPPDGNWNARMKIMREQLDEAGRNADISAKIIPVDAGGVAAEWVLAPGVTSTRRLLYIHGGAYMTGSAVSHRPITSRMSAVSGAAVLATNYRLIPEHTRMEGLEDCRTAYLWLLEHGSDATASAEIIFVVGDSSGGNMALSLLAWVRDQGVQPANAAVVFSPQTDVTLASPSLRNNIATDVMQGESFGPVVTAPDFVKLWMMFAMHRVSPSAKVISPLLGDLSGLPPTLVQASLDEMFMDDANRYVNKANAQGSEAVLQAWPHTIHVWQAFDLPEADDAFRRVGRFLAQY